MADIAQSDSNSVQHHETEKTAIRTSEERVLKVLDAFNCYINPFQIHEKNKLFTISSRASVKVDVEHDILNAEKMGAAAKLDFVDNRLKKKERFFDKIKRQNLKTFVNTCKKMVARTKDNTIHVFKQQHTIALHLLVKAHEDVSKLMAFPLTPVPYCLATADGFFTRTNKAKGMEYLLQDELHQLPSIEQNGILIQDGNALYHMLREIPDTFNLICQKIFDMMPPFIDIIFSTDMYQADSINK